MPLWARHVIGLIIALLVAFILAPVFPEPVSTIVYWLAIVAAVIELVLAAVALMRGPGI